MNVTTFFGLTLLVLTWLIQPALAGFKLYIPGQEEPAMTFTDQGSANSSQSSSPSRPYRVERHELAPGQYALIAEQEPGEESTCELTDSQGTVLVRTQLTPASTSGGTTFHITRKDWYTVTTTASDTFRYHIQIGPYVPPPASSPSPPPPSKPQPEHVDMTGVEWRQTRGLYSGRNSEESKRFGYRAGVYELAYTYNGDSDFKIWMRTRRGQTEQVVNLVRPRKKLRPERLESEGIVLRTRREQPRDRIIRSYSGSRAVQLQADDEVFFEIQTDGNWEFTFERIR